MSHAWMPLYVADYLADTTHLSAAEHGSYMLLIMHYWQHSGLPVEDLKLARICRLTPAEWQEIKGTLSDLFGANWTHKRIDEELAKADDLVAKRSAAGKAAAEARHNKRGASEPSNADQTHIQTDTPSPSPSPTEPNGSDSVSAREIDREFAEQFWPLWPNHVAKKPAQRAFVAARRKVPLETILTGVRRYARSKPPDRDWMHAATFLNGERWNDEPAHNPAKPSRNSGADNPVLRAVATAFAARNGHDQRQAGADVWDGADRPGAGADPGFDLDLEAAVVGRTG